jgi:hypothetical protein
MARRRKYTLADLPEAGTVFAVPLADGRVGVCRVLKKAIWMGSPCVLIAASDWIADKAPPLDHPAVQKILVLNHHNWSGKQNLVWVSEPPPREFHMLGRIEVPANDSNLTCGTYSGWDSPAIQVLAQWRWDNEREAVLAEDEKKRALESAKRTEAIQKRAEYLSKISFSDLLSRDLFPTWKGYPPRAAKTDCQCIIHSFIRTLDAAPKPLTRNFVSKELKQCVEALNQLDSRRNFIETVEREDLCEVLEDIVNAAKFPDLVEKVKDWRDW